MYHGDSMIRLPFRDGFYEVNPSKIICLGRNYAEHAKELGHEAPKEPVIFLKPPSALIGPNQTIILPRKSREVHHEVELAVIVGKRGKDIPRERAMDYVLGYTIFMDITARDLQSEAKKKGLPWTVAKGFDTFAPIEPGLFQKKSLIQVTLR